MGNQQLVHNTPYTENIKAFYISNNDFLETMRGNLVVNNIPEYCRLIDLYQDIRRRGFVFVLEHPSFPVHVPGNYTEMDVFDLHKPNTPIKNGGFRKMTFE